MYPEECLFVTCIDNNKIKNIVYLRKEHYKLIAGVYSPKGFIDQDLGETTESRSLIDDLRFNRTTLNSYLCYNGFIGFTRNAYDEQAIKLIYQALVTNYNSINALKMKFERISDDAAKRWHNTIQFTSNYDLYYLMHHPEKTAITSYSDLSIINGITKEQERNFELYLAAEIKMRLYALGFSYHKFSENTSAPHLLMIAAKRSGVKGYVGNNLRMRFVNDEVVFEYLPSIDEVKEK